MNIGRKKDAIVFILIILLALRVGHGIYKHNLNKIASMRSQIEKEKGKNDAFGTIGILGKKLEEYQKRSFSIRDTNRLLEKISRMAERVDVEIGNFNILSTIETEYYTELPLKIFFSCEYHQLGQFLSLIESEKEFIRIKELGMKKSISEEAIKPEIELTVSGIYLKK